MKKVIVKNLEGVQTHGAEMEDPTAWIAECEASCAWGQPGEYTVEIVDISAEYALQGCHRKRQMEYPSLGDFADAFVKMQGGDSSQMEAYVAACLAVKAKHPKP